MNDHTENLVREALAAEADRAPDPRPVFAAIARGRRRRLPTLAVVVAAATVAMAIAVAAVVVPDAVGRSATPPADQAPATDQDVLLVGTDGDGRADAVMLAHLGADGSSAVVSLPRDTAVRVAGQGTVRLNAVDQVAGTDALLDAVAGLTGVTVDHYVILPMAGFAPISEAAGGVPVCLRRAVSDPRSGASFPAGEQTVAGADALAFLRQRMGLPNGDLDRVARQQAFLAGLAGRLAAGEVDLAALLRAVRDEARLDPGWDLLDAADQLTRVEADRVRFGTIPVRLDDGMLAADPEQVRAFVAAAFGGDTGGGQPPGDPAAPGVGCVT